MKIIQWFKNAWNSLLGENDRKKLLDELKSTYASCRPIIEEKVNNINKSIEEFNAKIKDLNSIRMDKVKNNILQLSAFLTKFGKVKAIGEYTDESNHAYESLPNKEFEKIENHIKEFDCSKSEFSLKDILIFPIFKKRNKIRKERFKIMDIAQQFKLQAEKTVNELDARTCFVEQDKKICDLYKECIEIINKYIENVIIPELELVEAFFQAKQINNEMLSGQRLPVLAFKNNVESLKETMYEKHYMFVKNTFIFYVISCKIYNAPVLTRLLNYQSSIDDLELIKSQKKALISQGKEICNNLIIERVAS